MGWIELIDYFLDTMIGMSSVASTHTIIHSSSLLRESKVLSRTMTVEGSRTLNRRGVLPLSRSIQYVEELWPLHSSLVMLRKPNQRSILSRTMKMTVEASPVPNRREAFSLSENAQYVESYASAKFASTFARKS